jgi:hypothetical protein
LDKEKYIKGLEIFAVGVLTSIDLKTLLVKLELENEEQIRGFYEFAEIILDKYHKEMEEQDAKWADSVDVSKVN